jgi:histone deacetylase 1/2
MANFRPNAVVLQGGTDSLSGDRLGCFNLSVKGHSYVAEYMKTFGVPVLLLGGGGYTLRNVSRCWAYETSVMTGVEIPNEIPDNDYRIYFAPEFKIHMPVSNMENQNSKNYLNKTLEQIMKNLDCVSPSTVQIDVNGDNQPIKINVNETMRAKRDLWENANHDKNTDKNVD